MTHTHNKIKVKLSVLSDFILTKQNILYYMHDCISLRYLSTPLGFSFQIFILPLLSINQMTHNQTEHVHLLLVLWTQPTGSQ